MLSVNSLWTMPPAIDADADKTVGLVRCDSGQLRVDDFKNFNVLSPEGEAGEVMGIGLNQVFGNRRIRHARNPGALGERVWLRVNKIRDHA